MTYNTDSERLFKSFFPGDSISQNYHVSHVLTVNRKRYSILTQHDFIKEKVFELSMIFVMSLTENI